MRLLFIGCEWAGKHTLGIEVSRWWSEQTGESFLPPPHFSFHDHFVVPHVVHAMGHEHHKELSEKQMLTLNPGLLEALPALPDIQQAHAGVHRRAGPVPDGLVLRGSGVCPPLLRLRQPWGVRGPADAGQVDRRGRAQADSPTLSWC